MIKMDRLYWF